MTTAPFAHLHCHTHYSLLDGASRIPELVKRVSALGMNAVAMTDHGNLYGAIEFYKECRAGGVNPIVGYEAYVAPGKRTEREARRRGEAGFHLTLLARNLTGFQNLVKLSSQAFLEGYHYVPRIDKELLEAHSEGLICLSGCASSEFSELILREQMNEARELAEWFARVFGQWFYVEIQNNGLDIQRLCAAGAVDIANRLGLPLVATCDAHYLTREDASVHDVLLCINTGKTRDDPNRMRYGSDLFYVRAPHEMYELFPGHADAVRRSQEIADACDIQLDFKKRHFPVFVPPDSKTPEDYLRELCEEGLRWRYGEDPPQAARDRLAHELGVICRMGFASYFLIVHDFVRFAKEANIPCSARGSACGAVVSYALGLSHVDPLVYDLLFERFLDPNRSEAPDIDIDFCQDRREEVIAYVRRRYGEESVAQIATFGTMAARAAIKDVGRVLNIPLERVNQLTNMVPKILGVTLDDALEQSPELRQAYESDPDVRQLIDFARKLEGTNRSSGTHAAGVVISDGPLTSYVPLQRVVRKGENGGRGSEVVMTTQWVMGDLEKVGMLKMDFLGLRTLTLLNNAVRIIEKTRGEKIDIEGLPLDDARTYALLQRGDARGVFQFESDGIRELLKRLKPDNIRDIIACTALYRPGPLDGGMVDAYVNCKHGREKPVYAHEVMRQVLEETHGIMVYQEQVMRILNRLGGIELSSAYACIKAISKKKQEIIDQRRAEFLKGAQERGVPRETAEEIFRLITVFGGYGFNKCVIGSTTIIDADTGEPTTVMELFHHRRPFRIHALGEDGRLHARPVSDVVWNGRKPVFEVRTAQGKTITATGNHPFRTLDGWTNLEDLKPGDRIAAARRLPVTSTGYVPADTDLPAPPVVAPADVGDGPGETAHGPGGVVYPQGGAAVKVQTRRVTGAAVSDRLATSDVFWDRIVSIEPRGVQDTYDLTVEVDHNFVADGLIVHNSHSAAYAHVSYQTAYLKAHYTPEFMAALLTSEIDDGNKRDILVEHIEDSRRLGVDVLPPCVNHSDSEFTVEGGKIIFGLTAIKGCGRGAAEEIARARNEDGPFKDVFDLCERVDHKIVSRGTLEKLVKAGALDRLGGHRAQLMHVLPRAMQAAADRQHDRRIGQKSLFDAFGGQETAVAAPAQETLPDVAPWPETEKLKYEKEVLDFYFSSHPLAQEDRQLRRYASHMVEQARTLPANEEVLLGGMLTAVRFRNTKRARNGNTRFAAFKLEDITGAIECVIWPDDLARCKEPIEDDRICYIQGVLERSREEPTVVVSRVIGREQIAQERATGLWLRLRLGKHRPCELDALREVLQRTPGPVPVYLTISDAGDHNVVLKLGREFHVNAATFDQEGIESLLGVGSVRLA